MNDHRAAGQELQSQVMAAARKGQQRAQKTVRQMTSAAQQIRPHLANLPKPQMSSVPGQSQLRQRAPELASKLHARLPDPLQSRVPSPDQVKSSAQQFAGHARSVQRSVVSQVRNVASPLAQQAASRLSQLGAPADQSGTTTKVSQVTVKSDKAKNGATGTGKSSGASSSGTSKSSGSSSTKSTGSGSSGTGSSGSGSRSKTGSQGKPDTRSSASGSSSGTGKPRSEPTGK